MRTVQEAQPVAKSVSPGLPPRVRSLDRNDHGRPSSNLLAVAVAVLLFVTPGWLWAATDTAARAAGDPAQMTLMKYVLAGEMARAKPLVFYCEAAHAKATPSLEAAYAGFEKTLRKVTVAYLDRKEVDPDRPVPGDVKEFIEASARRCLADASRYDREAYCDALLDSFHAANEAKVGERVEAMFELMDALLASDRWTVTDGNDTSDEARDCGPSRIRTSSLPLRSR